MNKLGIIGGSGLYDIDALEDTESLEIETPFGSPSAMILRGLLHGTEVYFLPRHGRGHLLLPSDINHPANLFAFKKLGIRRVVSFTAVGSLREEIRPRDVFLPDQYFDRTKQNHTFFGHGLVGHVSFGDPVCPELRGLAARLATPLLAESGDGRRLHVGGTYVNMEGPVFSTRAESEFYRRQGFDVIGMTSLHEAKLAREAGMCYAAIALVTDYDCWHTEEAVQADLVVRNVQANIAFARRVLSDLAHALPASRNCGCGQALEGALMHDDALLDPAARLILDVLQS